MASIGSLGRPMLRANTLVDPPGSTPSAVAVPARPLAASLTVPSPPSTTTTSTPSAAAPWARRVAWLRRAVSTSSTSWSPASALRMMTRVRAVTDDENGLTSSRTFTPDRTVGEPCAPGRGCPGPRGLDGCPGTGLRLTSAASICGGGPGRTNSPVMNVVVCVKQIPDPADPGALNADHTLKRDGKLILDESDSYGVEMALQLVDKAGEGEVTLVSMAPNGEVSGLRTALAMGAAKAILVSDDALKGAGALDTAKVLAAAIKRVEGADLVLAATESSDGYTGTVPEQIAAMLDLPVDHLRQVGRDRRRHRQGAAPDRGRLRRVRVAPPGARLRDRRCGRAPLPLLQGDHGGQVQAGRQAHGRRPRHRRRHRRLGRRRPGDRRRRPPPPSARPARSSRTTAKPT